MIPPNPNICEACGKPATADTICDIMGTRHSEPVEAVVRRAVLAEREACAKVAEDDAAKAVRDNIWGVTPTANRIAAAIRARK